MGDDTESLVDQVRRVAERLIKEHYAEEERFFTAVWEVFEKWLKQLKVPVERIVLSEVLHTRAGLGFVGDEGLDLVSPIVLSTVAETLQESRKKNLSVSNLERIVGRAAARAGAAGGLLACLVGHLPEMVIAVRSADDSVSEAYVSVAKKGQKQQIEVKFALARVVVRGREVEYHNAWRMLEYFLWKKDRVHWLEGYLIYPRWWKEGVSNPQKLFREKIDGYAKKLRDKYGIEIEFKTNRRRKANYWEFVRHNLLTNIPEAEDWYKKAEELFENRDFTGARANLIKALEIYPRHLQSHFLVAKCCEEQGFVNISADEISRVLRTSWEYMRRKCRVLEGIAKIVSERKDEELEVFFIELRGSPVYSGLKEHARVLGEWLRTNVFTEEDRIVAKLRMLLETIVNSTNDAVKRASIAELCKMPCVKDVMNSIGKDSLKITAHLFYPDSQSDSQSTRLQTMAKLDFSHVRQFKAYFKKTLEGVEKEIPQEQPGKLPKPDISLTMERRVKDVNRIEAQLRQKLHKEPSKPELVEAIEKARGWDIKEIRDVLDFRKFQVTLREDMSILADDDGSPHTDNKDDEQVIQQD